jgi:hypothetical protein
VVSFPIKAKWQKATNGKVGKSYTALEAVPHRDVDSALASFMRVDPALFVSINSEVGQSVRSATHNEQKAYFESAILQTGGGGKDSKSKLETLLGASLGSKRMLRSEMEKAMRECEEAAAARLAQEQAKHAEKDQKDLEYVNSLHQHINQMRTQRDQLVCRFESKQGDIGSGESSEHTRDRPTPK